MSRYLPPAGIDDFSRSSKAELLRQKWHEEVSKQIADIKSSRCASPLFYDQLADTSGVPDSAPQGIPWNGFPLRLDNWYAVHSPKEQREKAHRAAEVVLRKAAFGLYRRSGTKLVPLELPFRVQDEYCEWHVERQGQTIRRISFTCEPPEYWEHLARHDFDLVLKLYKELLHNDTIQDADLRWQHDVFSDEGELVYAKGSYNRWNVWNTEKGAVHLTHPANSLYAELYLASDGTLGWPVQPDASGKVDAQSLMGCAGAGGINRSSDPLILQGVFNFARQGLCVALANPIGLYMAPFTLDGLLDPDENPIGGQSLTFTRKSADGSRVLRAELAPPAGANYTLDKCTLNGDDLRYGGQITRGITMRLFGVAKQIPNRKPRRVLSCPTFTCQHPEHTLFTGTFSVGKTVNCSRVTKEDWDLETYDVPTLDGPLLDKKDGSLFDAKAAAPLEKAAAPLEKAAAPEPKPLKLVGRKVVAVDDAPAIELEDL